MQKKQPITRRSFLEKTAIAAGSALALPVIIPASARGADGTVAPSNRIVMGAIGVGSMGQHDLRAFLEKPEVQMVAVCDVDRRHREQARQLVDEKYKNNNCKGYLDFRELIGRGDLDAVQTTLPDHWHAIPAIAAARAPGSTFTGKNHSPGPSGKAEPSAMPSIVIAASGKRAVSSARITSFTMPPVWYATADSVRSKKSR